MPNVLLVDHLLLLLPRPRLDAEHYDRSPARPLSTVLYLFLPLSTAFDQILNQRVAKAAYDAHSKLTLISAHFHRTYPNRFSASAYKGATSKKLMPRSMARLMHATLVTWLGSRNKNKHVNISACYGAKRELVVRKVAARLPPAANHTAQHTSHSNGASLPHFSRLLDGSACCMLYAACCMLHVVCGVYLPTASSSETPP